MTLAYFSRLCSVFAACEAEGVVPETFERSQIGDLTIPAYRFDWWAFPNGKRGRVSVLENGSVFLVLMSYEFDPGRRRRVKPGTEREAVAEAVRWVKGEG